MTKKRILIVDDSVVIQKLLFTVLNSEPDFEVVGICSDPFEAKEYLVTGQVDCMILDLEMPKMDGLTFLKKIMLAQPTPIVILSGALDKNPSLYQSLLDAGAHSAFSKPYGFDQAFFTSLKEAIRSTHKIETQKIETFSEFIFIASSTGGTEGVKRILKNLPQNATAPVIVIQHMAEQFTKTFADTLNKSSYYNVKEAAQGDIVEGKSAYVAPGNFHIEVKRSAPNKYFIEVNQKPHMHSVRPAADITFLNLSADIASRSTVIILSGMGRDGADGVAHLKKLGAKVIAESEESCIVFGMPKAAIATGAVDKVLSLDQICSYLQNKYQNENAA